MLGASQNLYPSVHYLLVHHRLVHIIGESHPESAKVVFILDKHDLADDAVPAHAAAGQGTFPPPSLRCTIPTEQAIAAADSCSSEHLLFTLRRMPLRMDDRGGDDISALGEVLIDIIG